MTFPLPIDLRGYRRPATPKEIADRAGVVLIPTWNQALENGTFRTVAASANNPEPTLAYYGSVVANDQFHGTQTIYAVGASDVAYRREFFLAGDGATFHEWELVDGTKLITDWQFALLNGRYRSEANAVGAPDPTLAYYGFTINSDTLHGTQHVWARGATSVEYEREFYLGGSGGVEYSAWRRILQPSEIITTATVTGPETAALARPLARKIFENISLFDVMQSSLADAIKQSEVTGADATEITTKINNLLSDVGGIVRGEIFAPGGTYFFTGAGLFCPDKLRLLGEGPKVTLFRKAPGSSDLDPILRERVSGGVFVPADDVQVENVGFIGNGDPATPGAKGAGLLRFYAHSRLRLLNNHFSMSRGYGVGLQGALPSPNADRRGPHIDTYIEGCHFWSNGKQAYLTGSDTDDGIDLKGSERLVVLNSRAWDNGDKGFDFRGKSVTAIGNFSYKNAGSGFSSGLEGVAAGVTSVDDGSHEYFGCYSWENGDANFVANGQTTPGVTSGRISVSWNGCVSRKATNHNFSIPSKGTNDMLALSVALRGVRSFDPVSGAHFNASAVLDSLEVEGGRFEGGVSAGVTVNTAQVRPVRINGASFKSIALNAINLSADASAHSVVANNTFDTIGGAAINGVDYVTTSGNDYTGVGNSQVVLVTGQNCKIKDNPVGTRTIASAATLTLPTLSDSFLISGSTTITAITSSYDGREVSLVFNAACTVTHSSALRLKSGANLSAVANTTLRLRYFNGSWREV